MLIILPTISSGTQAGRFSKMGNRYLRRLLFLGAMAQVSASRRGESVDGV
nr:IS110 family transposase [Pseudoruegeria sp. SK021]